MFRICLQMKYFYQYLQKRLKSNAHRESEKGFRKTLYGGAAVAQGVEKSSLSPAQETLLCNI